VMIVSCQCRVARCIHLRIPLGMGHWRQWPSIRACVREIAAQSHLLAAAGGDTARIGEPHPFDEATLSCGENAREYLTPDVPTTTV
jgi:hypothetical protein